MAAVVGPIRIDDLELRYGGITLFRIAEVVAAERKIRNAHRKAHLRVVLRNFLMRPCSKAGHPLDIGGPVRVEPEALR